MCKKHYDKNSLKREWILNPISMFILGLVFGIGSRMLDLNTDIHVLGVVFSQVSVWILICTLISIYSPAPKYAMYNVFPFCINMLISYYIYDDLVAQSSSTYAYLWWSVVAVAAPVLAYVVWFTKESGIVPRIIRWGVLIVSILSSIVIFDGFEYWDIIINAILAYFLFFKKTDRLKLQKRMIYRQMYKFKQHYPEEFNELLKDNSKDPG